MLSTKTRPAPSSLASDAERPSKKRRLSNSDDENAALLLSTRAIFAQPLAVPRAQSHIHPLELLSMQASLTDSDDDDRSTTDAEDDQDELARDELVAPSNASQLDTTIDYAFLKGHVETPLTVGELPEITLIASQTPCLDALAFCIVLRLGAYQTVEDERDGIIRMTNFPKALAAIQKYCPKKSQTKDEHSRIKALKRWFDGIPYKRKRSDGFTMRTKPNRIPEVMQTVKKMQEFCIAGGLVKALNPVTQQTLRPNS